MSHPPYVKSGTTLTLICQDPMRSTIDWVKHTAQTSPEYKTVYPNESVIIQTCTDEPSGFTKSTLFLSNMSLNARGWYKCKTNDGSSSYQTHVTVLYSMLIAFVCFCVVLQRFVLLMSLL